MERTFNVFDKVLQELIDLHEQTRCGCGDPVCRKCRDDRQIEETIAMGLSMDDPLDETDRKRFEALRWMFFHMMPEKSPETYFICGEAGSKDEDRLPEYISICPAYGVGWSILYKKVDNDRSDDDQ